MKVKSLCYTKNSAWSQPLPAMDSPNTVVFVFGAPEFLEFKEPFTDLKNKFPSSTIVGCSSAGEIFGTKVQDHSLSVAVVQFDKTKVGVACFPIENPTDSSQVGESLAKSLNREGLAATLLFSEGLTINGSELIQGFNNVLKNTKVAVSGGLAGDGSDFKKTWVLKNGFPVAKHVSAIAFYGDKVSMTLGSQGGWDIFGPERIITRSTGNTIYEIDGEPALTLYKNYLGDKAKDLPASGLLFPLQIRKNLDDEKRLVRTILAVDPKENSLTFAGDVPQGWYAQLMKANFSRLIQGASDATLTTKAVSGPLLNIAISCVGRRLVLGQRTVEELEAVLKNLPKGTEQVGFYSYGELSPALAGEPCELHNQTMTLSLIGETT